MKGNVDVRRSGLGTEETEDETVKMKGDEGQEVWRTHESRETFTNKSEE